ncbi:UNVERIFIED_CONTAM: hypothetical protein Sradi_5759900 [Sesamum radiatum]|uniref:Uncharacterized protein n=1 Tax=Sesamum radiatum TaxID=300843 RepID=A0AAW2L2W6_SESRA
MNARIANRNRVKKGTLYVSTTAGAGSSWPPTPSEGGRTPLLKEKKKDVRSNRLSPNSNPILAHPLAIKVVDQSISSPQFEITPEPPKGKAKGKEVAEGPSEPKKHKRNSKSSRSSRSSK